MDMLSRRARVLVVSLLLALSAAVAAAEQDPTAHEAQYLRWHDSALAFAETLERLAGRYPALASFDRTEALGLIARSERAARERDFAAASGQARRAYEVLRSAIAAAVAQGGR